MSGWPRGLGILPLHALSSRIAIPAGFLALVSVGSLAFILIREQRQQVLGEVAHGSENVAEAILLSLNHDMRVNEQEGVRELIESLGRHGDIESIRVFNPDGEVSYSSKPGEVGSRIPRETATRDVMVTTHVINNRSDCAGSDCHKAVAEQPVLGTLDVAMSVRQARLRLSAATTKAVVVSLGVAALISAILLLLVRLQLWAEKLAAEVAAEARELREAHYQIMQAEKLSSVGLMAAGIAHELNSPLMAIITFSHLVRSSLPKDARAHEDLRMIEREANRCAGIIRQLLDYSRKQSHEPDTRPCSVRRIVEGAVDLLKVELQNADVAVETDIDHDLPFIEVNDQQLMQVFVNLLMNAVHAMPQGGRIHVTADMVERRQYPRADLPPHEGEDLVRIRVRDNGTGISREHLTRVFDPFFTTKPVGKGSGLGLSVSLGLVRGYRGTILAESDGRSWTEFTILLPVVPESALAGSV